MAGITQAEYLRGRGVGPDSVVGIFMPPSVEYVIAMLGIMSAGGAYLVIELAYVTADSIRPRRHSAVQRPMHPRSEHTLYPISRAACVIPASPSSRITQHQDLG